MRDGRIDAARGALIIGVVVGHFLERSHGWDGGVQRLALTVLYAFHMPAFVFLTGTVAKPSRTLRKVLGLLSILVGFQIVYLVVLAATGVPLLEWYWPYWVLWFIMAMIWWQLLVPLIKRYPVTMLVLSVLVALLAGYADPHGNWFAYQRTLVFLPFFIVGCAWGGSIIDVLQRLHVAVKLALAAVFLAYAVLLFRWDPEPHWLFQNWTYGQLGESGVDGPILRGGVLIAGALGTAMLLSVVSSAQRPLVWIGRRTLPVFLFHVFPVLAFGWLLMPSLEHVPGSVLLLLGCGLGIGIAYVCAATPFVIITDGVRRFPETVLPARRARSRSTAVS